MNEHPFLLRRFLFSEASQIRAKIKRFVLSDVDASSSDRETEFPSLDALFASLYTPDVSFVPPKNLTPETIQIIKTNFIPSLYQQLVREMEKVDDEGDIVVFIELPSVTKDYVTVYLESDNGTQTIRSLTVSNPAEPGKEKLSTGEFSKIPNQPYSRSSRYLKNISQEDALLRVTDQINKSSLLFSEEDREELIKRIYSHIQTWFKNLDGSTKKQKTGIKRKFRDPKQFQLGKPRFLKDQNGGIFGVQLWISISKTGSFEQGPDASLSIQFSFDPGEYDKNLLYTFIKNEHSQLYNHSDQLNRSKDPIVQKQFNGFVGLERVVDTQLRAFLNVVDETLQKPHRDEAEYRKAEKNRQQEEEEEGGWF